MKAAIYLDQGVTQVVLTPENGWEREALRMIADSGEKEVKNFWGKFYECQGGWVRHGQTWYEGNTLSEETSLIFRIDKKLDTFKVENA